MFANHKLFQYESPLAPLIKRLIREKRTAGHKYDTSALVLKDFDHFLCQTSINPNELPKNLVLQWLDQQPNEKSSTRQRRIVLIRQLARLMIRLGYSAFLPPYGIAPKRSFVFSPRILTHEEVRKIIQAADQLKPNAKSPWRNIVIPEVFRLLYSCGFRVSEVLNLRIRDIDLKQGVIIVRRGKFGKDRLVPPALDMVERLRVYAQRMEKESLEKRTEEAFFFPSSRKQGGLSGSGIYSLFRQLLYQCGISHGGRGKGPRVHDLRHTFAVHRLIQWYEEGADLNAKLPFLVAYLGHKDFTGTQKYLHLTAELFPNITKRMNEQFGGVIPQGR
ncbi:tyrosine-type recombinase/integrase [Legionella jordanis]|uniref:Tyrosine recombinase XerD n=1 Tax=Legionella jordanis TaxID=456 RepID=A0A0W0VF43_9GAMM|nr:tyrosine-type recombinase/integrase [Legionella jordanis]KTD18265.1 Tyrosine recombinase XerD [Legionella jordanis]RMX01209.1 integrase [Legionella jordanis]VEH13392.1 Tyrosine recombinase XerD [Legionella jordanis]VEH13652.1 Tyrosine recombinase XerD [Legionella jordanis]